MSAAARPRRAAPAPLPEYRRAAHAKAVEARESLGMVTRSLHGCYNPPRTAADWLELARWAEAGARWAADVASVARDAAAALEAGEA